MKYTQLLDEILKDIITIIPEGYRIPEKSYLIYCGEDAFRAAQYETDADKVLSEMKSADTWSYVVHDGDPSDLINMNPTWWLSNSFDRVCGVAFLPANTLVMAWYVWYKRFYKHTQPLKFNVFNFKAFARKYIALHLDIIIGGAIIGSEDYDHLAFRIFGDTIIYVDPKGDEISTIDEKHEEKVEPFFTPEGKFPLPELYFVHGELRKSNTDPRGFEAWEGEKKIIIEPFDLYHYIFMMIGNRFRPIRDPAV